MADSTTGPKGESVDDQMKGTKKRALRARNRLDETRARFQVEEYKEVLMERRFVMTRFMQALALYLALSAFALKELVEMEDLHLALVLEVCFTLLNLVAVYVAKHFRRMASHALERERYFVNVFGVEQMYDLFGATEPRYCLSRQAN